MTDNDRPWGRRLVICCDGTWQSSVTLETTVPSNVTKLCRLIARVGIDQKNPSKKFHQIVYYDSGIGTGNIGSSEKNRQGGTGAGLAENVIEAYNFIVQNYEPGDEIFCFGFSRGAYTARAVAGLVSDIGVIAPISMQFFPDLYRLYQTNDEGVEFRKTEAWRWFTEGKLSKKGEELKKQGVDVNNIGMDDLKLLAEAWDIRPHGELAVSADSRKVKVVGVWDTVGSLGIPDMAGLNLASQRTQYGFHNVKLTENIQHAFQALALDERRKAFRPTLWYIPKDLINDPNRPTPELKQVWFPGTHINCGGGAQDAIEEMKGDSENIATATLCWMLQVISPYLTIDREGLLLHLDQYKRWLFRIRYACTYRHPTLLSTTLSYVPKLSSLSFVGAGNDALKFSRVAPHTHDHFDFGWGTGPIVDSFTVMYHLNGMHVRVPGHEYVEGYDEKLKTQRWVKLTDLGDTNEYIHPITYYRSLVRGWESHSPLRKSWNREAWEGKRDGKVRFWWYMDGEKDKYALPEWKILIDDSDEQFNFERKWYEECEKSENTLEKLADVEDFGERDFLEVLDEKLKLVDNYSTGVSW